MIIRARPKYLKESFFNFNYLSNKVNIGNELFFNSGRSALKFVLEEYARYRDKKLVVGVQAFNCVAVAEGVLQSNSQMMLIDIGLEDFSIRLDTIRKISTKIDVLILTHYQGIINIEYKKIAEFCKENNILLIDDLAQTKGSMIKDIEVGMLSNVSINSFAFDKPIVVMNGEVV